MYKDPLCAMVTTHGPMGVGVGRVLAFCRIGSSPTDVLEMTRQVMRPPGFTRTWI